MALLEVDAVEVRFGGVVAVREASFAVEEGCIVGLMGPNGAGKTTLFNVITGLQEPTSGRVRFQDRDVTDIAPRRRATMGIGRTFQRLEVFGSLTVGDNIRVAAEMRGIDSPTRVREALLDRVGLTAFADVPADSVPTGIARLTELARALACDPRLLLLDEPSSGLSDDETDDFEALVRSLAEDDGRSVLLVEHDVELVDEPVLDHPCPGLRHHHRQRAAGGDRGRQAGAGRLPRRRRCRRCRGRPRCAGGAGVTTTAGARPTDETVEPPALELVGITAAYGRIQVLHGVDLVVPRGTVVALLGPNGAGKTTALRVASGQMTPTSGHVHLSGHHLNGVDADRLARAGLCTVPEGRGVFPNLTVEENIRLFAYTATVVGEGGPRPHVHAVPPAGGATHPAGRPVVRRRAADAGDGARALDRPRPAACSTSCRWGWRR